MRIYISENIDFNCVSSYFIIANGCENIWVHISTKTFKKYVVRLIHRHPKFLVNEIIVKLSESLQKVNSESTKCVVTGDININLLNETFTSVSSYL